MLNGQMVPLAPLFHADPRCFICHRFSILQVS
jgi:hypothetical protein